MNIDDAQSEIPMNRTRLAGILEFIQAAERLKDTLRSGKTRGGRAESAAEHSWRLCLMAMMFSNELPGIDYLRLIKLCIIHDLGEALGGDIPAINQVAGDNRDEREREDLARLAACLPEDLKDELLLLWDEYTAGQTQEAIFAKGFDKLETILQHNLTPENAAIRFAFNLTYGKERTDRHPLLRQIRSVVDEQTAENAARQKLLD